MKACGCPRSARAMPALGRVRQVVTLSLMVLFPGMGLAASAQGEPAGPPDPSEAAQAVEPPHPRPLRCPKPATPHRLHFTCVRSPFDVLEETLTKDWAGVRTDLAELGITPTASYTSQVMGNLTGGQSRGGTYPGVLEASVAWDLQKLLRVPGLSVNVGASWAAGQSLSAEKIGNVFTVQSVFAGASQVSLTQLYLQQDVFAGALTLAAGRLAPADTFATLPVFNNYLNGGINPVPGALGINDPIFTSTPTGVEWGAQILYDVTRAVEVSVGIFNTNPKAAIGNKNGVNFAFTQGNTGVLTVGQVSYLFNQAAGDAGLPGQYAIGGSYNSNGFPTLSGSPPTLRGNYSMYALAQQMVYRDGEPGSQRGLTAWGAAAVSPKPSVSPIPWNLAGGVSYQGLMSGRLRDIASLGVVYGNFSHHVPGATTEIVVEANYQVVLTRWLSLTPDFQYVIRPSGSKSIPNAAALGVGLAVTF